MSDTNENESQIILPDDEKLMLSVSPHISTCETTRRIMCKVLLALFPAVFASVLLFGMRAFWVILFTTVCCVGAEALWCFFAKKPILNTIGDCSAIVTGVLLAMNLSAEIPYYICIIGAFLAIWLAKQVFGGLGHNPFNPALVARVGLLIAFPAAMTTWGPVKASLSDDAPANAQCVVQGVMYETPPAALTAPDAVSCATPLGIVKTTPKILGHSLEAENNFSDIDDSSKYWDFFLGKKSGCLGETSVLALLLGGLMLIGFKLINWRVPVCYIGTVAIITGTVNYFCPGVTPTPLFHILTGGLMIGAIFMATDMVTSPITNAGCVIFAIGCGVVASVIRIWGNYPEGVSFSIIFMNALVPLIDRLCSQRPFGYVTKRG